MASLQIRPVLAALRHHRGATVLIVLQIALTLGIVCNALFIIQQRLEHIARPTGIDEANIAVIHNQWIGKYTTAQMDAMTLSDLAALQRLPGVVDAYDDYTYPAVGPMAQLSSVRLTRDQHTLTSHAEPYYTDDHALPTLGLRLIAGRNFRADEIMAVGDADTQMPPVIIITSDLAERLFPHQVAVGRAVYLGNTPSTIIGVIAHLQVPAIGTHSFAYCAVLLPRRNANFFNNGSYYIVRAQSGQLDAVMRAAPRALFTLNRMRVLDEAGGMQRYSDLRETGYRRDRGMTLLLGMICAVLLAATVGGVVGLSSFWVSQRQKQIGIRRALGATRGDILRYFQTENFLIVSFGIALGMLQAFALNLTLMKFYELPRLPLYYLPIGALMLWLLGQLAVLGPALRAAAVSPVVATRSV
ncbi:ABC transporter permease [Rhodanobacter sp. MP1X3]|uniref:ABC transporter permease n=1 Tax=Rhodanobacter sp. MP1X3 TaxID=2723086 RepID=UPI00160A4254|nr:ABC transporter permease [Rhodanobacter sp. MP1X3]MBB6242850.1 putative ABC transport system permease protein [Rhodanobacter sp. MP1X3]